MVLSRARITQEGENHIEKKSPERNERRETRRRVLGVRDCVTATVDGDITEIHSEIGSLVSGRCHSTTARTEVELSQLGVSLRVSEL